MIERVEDQGYYLGSADSDEFSGIFGDEKVPEMNLNSKKPKIQIPQRSSIFKVMTTEVKINHTYKEHHPSLYFNEEEKQKFKDKVELNEMAKVRTIKRFFQ